MLVAYEVANEELIYGNASRKYYYNLMFSFKKKKKIIITVILSSYLDLFGVGSISNLLLEYIF